MNPQIAAAQSMIASLKSGGMSYAEIARKVGRDTSYISQAARGKKGGNLVEALEKISKGEKPAPVERKQTKTGNEAKVRKGIQHEADGHLNYKTKTGDKTMMSALKQAGDKLVKWKVKVKKAKTMSDKEVKNTGFDGGTRGKNLWSGNKLLDRINNPEPGDNWKAGQALKAMAEIGLRQDSGLTSYTSIQEVQMHTVN